jgi:sigma-B regulation protein RsbU (phosphoserine phosphatase)
MSILIVDDSYFNRKLVESLLNKAGYLDILHAASAAEAYLHLENQPTNKAIDIILLDIMMPEIDGLEACKYIKTMPSCVDIPIIMVTAINESQSLQNAFDAGAMDYITKPVNPTVLRARVRSALTLKKEMDRRKAREQDLIEIGAKIQQTLLLGKLPECFPDLNIAALTQASQRVDGDFYDFICHQDKCLDVFIGDVMGKGVPAALIGAATKANFYRAITQLIFQNETKQIPYIEQIVQHVHQVMSNELIELEKFVTLCYVRYHSSDNSIDLVDCGHTQTIHYQANTNNCSLIKGDNTPLGFIPDENYQQIKFNFNPGDILFLYSDGFTEACRPDGTFFGEDRLVACIKEYFNQDPNSIVKHIQEEVFKFARTDRLGDDLTCVVLKRKPETFVCAINESIKPNDVNPFCEYNKSCRSIKIKSTLNELKGVREFVIDYCQSIDLGMDPKTFVWQLETAIVELISNVIKYAYLNEAHHDIVICTDNDDNQVRLIVHHWGKPFPNPPASPSPPEDEYPEGGYGLFIIDNYIDQCVYLEKDDTMNSIVLIKKIVKDKVTLESK